MNRLLATLPKSVLRPLMAQGEHVDLHAGDSLFHSGADIEHAVFPTHSTVALMLPLGGESSIHVGLIGSEGMVGSPLVLGVNRSPILALVRSGGLAWRFPAAVFAREVDARPALRRMVLRYLQVRMTQLAQIAACNRFHVVEQRLARLLLVIQDGEHNARFHVTHESLARLLGVRRVGITKAAHTLQDRALIQYRRGDIWILDRSGMKAASCSCYQTDKNTYDQLLRS